MGVILIREVYIYIRGLPVCNINMKTTEKGKREGVAGCEATNRSFRRQCLSSPNRLNREERRE